MTRASLVDRSVGSVHTGFGLCALAAGGSLNTHVHSFEELWGRDGDPGLDVSIDAWESYLNGIAE